MFLELNIGISKGQGQQIRVGELEHIPAIMAPMAKRMLFVGVAAVALVAGVGFVVARWQAERELRRQGHTLAEAVRRVTKLATVEVDVSNWQLRSDSKKLLGFLPFRCEKTVAVFYRGKVAAGFDIAPQTAVGLRVDVDQTNRKVRIELPPARILYTDVPPPDLVVSDGSICNKLTPRGLHAVAHRRAGCC